MTGERELYGFTEDQYKAMVKAQTDIGCRVYMKSEDGREREGGERIIRAFYRHHVLVESLDGFRESYTYFDIYRWLNKIIFID